MLAKAREAELP